MFSLKWFINTKYEYGFGWSVEFALRAFLNPCDEAVFSLHLLIICNRISNATETRPGFKILFLSNGLRTRNHAFVQKQRKKWEPQSFGVLSFSDRCSPDVDVTCILKYTTCWHAAKLKLNDSWSSQHSYMLPCHCCLDKMPWLIFIKSDELWQFLLLSGQPWGSSNL